MHKFIIKIIFMQEITKSKSEQLIKTFGQIVEKHRKAQGKTAYKISAEIALSKTTWREVELGANDLKFTTMWKIAEGLDIPLEKLISEVNKKLGEEFSLSGIK